MCGSDSEKNCVHGSDSRASAAREIPIFFPEVSPGQFLILFTSAYNSYLSLLANGMMLKHATMVSKSNHIYHRGFHYEDRLCEFLFHLTLSKDLFYATLNLSYLPSVHPIPSTCNTLVLHTLIFQILYICTQGISNEFSSLILFYWRQLFVFFYVIPYIHLSMFISVTCTSSSSHFFDARHSSSCNKVGPTASCILWIRLLTLVIILVLISDGVEKLRLGLFGRYMMDSNGLGCIMLFTSCLFLLIQDKTFRYMMSFRKVKHWACNVEVM